MMGPACAVSGARAASAATVMLVINRLIESPCRAVKFMIVPSGRRA